MPKASGKKKSRNQLSRTYFVQFEGHHDEAYCRKAYRAEFRRQPDTLLTPEQSHTPWWWAGYVDVDEIERFNDKRQLRFDFFGQTVRRVRKISKPVNQEEALFDGPNDV